MAPMQPQFQWRRLHDDVVSLRSLMNRAGSPGSSDTPKSSRRRDNPSPVALMKDSLRVQHLRKASDCSAGLRLKRAAHSRGAKNRVAIASRHLDCYDLARFWLFAYFGWRVELACLAVEIHVGGVFLAIAKAFERNDDSVDVWITVAVDRLGYVDKR